jgi:flagellar protein FlgJ
MSYTTKNHFKEPKDKREFIMTMYPIAQEAEGKLKTKGYSVSYMAIMAMAAVESRWGEDMRGNMYFEKPVNETVPIKERQLLLRRRLHDSPGYKGYPEIIEVMPLEDGQFKYIVKEWFRKYEKPIDNIMEHFEGIMNNYAYANAMHVCSHTRLFIEKLVEAGYTYNKRYEPEKDYARKALNAVAMINRNIDYCTAALANPHLVRLAVRTGRECNPSSLDE